MVKNLNNIFKKVFMYIIIMKGCDIMVVKVRLERVSWGAADTSEENKEWQLDGVGPVGTKEEWKKAFQGKDVEFEYIEIPRTDFEIIDEEGYF